MKELILLMGFMSVLLVFTIVFIVINNKALKLKYYADNNFIRILNKIMENKNHIGFEDKEVVNAIEHIEFDYLFAQENKYINKSDLKAVNVIMDHLEDKELKEKLNSVLDLYNDSALEYNIYLKTFPASLLLKTRLKKEAKIFYQFL